MNEYQITYSDGSIVEIEAWTPEAAHTIAEEDVEENGSSGLAVVNVELLVAREMQL
jgi:hypothetical protein